MVRKIIAAVLVIGGLVLPTFCIGKSIQFKQQCSGFLKQAADASTVELALERLDKAIAYLEEHNLTVGYTSILWKTEDDNIGFWYQNLKACRSELEDALDATQLEKTNVLMKVRESLTDEGEKGTKLTIPEGVCRFPHNAIYSIGNISSILAIIIGCAIFGF